MCKKYLFLTLVISFLAIHVSIASDIDNGLWIYTDHGRQCKPAPKELDPHWMIGTYGCDIAAKQNGILILNNCGNDKSSMIYTEGKTKCLTLRDLMIKKEQSKGNQ